MVNILLENVVIFNIASKVFHVQLPVANVDYSIGHLHTESFNGPHEVLVSYHVSPGLAPVGGLDDVGEVVQQNLGLELKTKVQTKVRNLGEGPY